MAIDEHTRTLLRERELFLEGGADPTERGIVRPAIAHSWKRSLMYGLEPERSRPTFRTDTQSAEQLLTVGVPVVESKRSALVDSSSSLALTDANGYVVARWVEDRGFSRRLDQHDVLPGGFHSRRRPSEPTVGGMVLETGHAAMVAGPEHFFAESLQLTCAGGTDLSAEHQTPGRYLEPDLPLQRHQPDHAVVGLRGRRPDRASVRDDGASTRTALVSVVPRRQSGQPACGGLPGREDHHQQRGCCTTDRTV